MTSCEEGILTVETVAFISCAVGVTGRRQYFNSRTERELQLKREGLNAHGMNAQGARKTIDRVLQQNDNKTAVILGQNVLSS